MTLKDIIFQVPDIQDQVGYLKLLEKYFSDEVIVKEVKQEVTLYFHPQIIYIKYKDKMISAITSKEKFTNYKYVDDIEGVINIICIENYTVTTETIDLRNYNIFSSRAELKPEIMYTLWNGIDYIGIFSTYKKALDYCSYKFKQPCTWEDDENVYCNGQLTSYYIIEERVD